MIHNAEQIRVIAGELLIEKLKDGGEVTAFTMGRSMMPLIPPSARVSVKPVICETLKIGDIVLLKNPGSEDSVYLHRIMSIDFNAQTVFTKGDSCNSFDPPTAFNNVLGILVEVERRHLSFRTDNPVFEALNPLIGRLSPHLPPVYKAARLLKKAVKKIAGDKLIKKIRALNL